MSIKMSLAELEVNKRDGSKVMMNAVIDNSTTEALEKLEQKKVKILEEIPDDYEEMDAKVDELREHFNDISEVVETNLGGEKTYVPEYETIDGEFIQASTSGGYCRIATASAYKRTDYIPINHNDLVVYSYTGLNPTMTGAFFREDKTGIIGSQFSATSEAKTSIAPSEAKYLVISAMASRFSNFTFEITSKKDGKIQEDISEIKTELIAVNEKMDTIKPTSSASEKDIPLFVSMMPDFFWVSTNEIAAFSNGSTKYKEGEVAATNNAWFAISGRSGDDYVTVISGGNGDMSDITDAEKLKWIGAVIMYDDGRYYPCNMKYKSSTEFYVFPKLEKDIANGELAQIRTGIHLSRRGYRAYSQFLYRQNPKHCEKSEYIARWREEDTIPWRVFGSNNKYVSQVGNMNIETAYANKLLPKSYSFGYYANWGSDNFNDVDGGIEWEVDTNGKGGYVEFYIGLNSNSDGVDEYHTSEEDAFHCELYIDDILVKEYIKTLKVCERICFDFENGKRTKLKIYCKRWRNTIHSMKVNRVTWWVNNNYKDNSAKLFPKASMVAQMFDSWGEFHDGESGVYLSKEINADAEITVPYENHSKGSQTSAWGKSWFFENVWKYHPTICIINFGINDTNSMTSSSIPNTIIGADGKAYNNKIDSDEYIKNMSTIIDSAINNKIKPIIVGVGLQTYQTFGHELIDAISENVSE